MEDLLLAIWSPREILTLNLTPTRARASGSCRASVCGAHSDPDGHSSRRRGMWAMDSSVPSYWNEGPIGSLVQGIPTRDIAVATQVEIQTHAVLLLLT